MTETANEQICFNYSLAPSLNDFDYEDGRFFHEQSENVKNNKRNNDRKEKVQQLQQLQQ